MKTKRIYCANCEFKTVCRLNWKNKFEECKRWRDSVKNSNFDSETMFQKLDKIKIVKVEDLIDEDFFDSKGSDISKKEFLENEMFFGMME